MLAVLTRLTRGVRVRSLARLMARDRLDAAKTAYGFQLMWQTGAQLYAMGGGSEYPVPDYFSLFPDSTQADPLTAEDIRSEILGRL